MPCRDYQDDQPEAYYGPKLRSRDEEIAKLKKQISFAESALCQVLVSLQHVDFLVETISPKTGDWYDWINFKEAGITKAQLVDWHKEHKKLDEAHREKERLSKVKKEALAKLSAEEKKALGIK